MDTPYERPRRTHTCVTIDYETRDMLRELAASEDRPMTWMLKRWVHAEYAKLKAQPAAPA